MIKTIIFRGLGWIFFSLMYILPLSMVGQAQAKAREGNIFLGQEIILIVVIGTYLLGTSLILGGIDILGSIRDKNNVKRRD